VLENFGIGGQSLYFKSTDIDTALRSCARQVSGLPPDTLSFSAPEIVCREEVSCSAEITRVPRDAF